MKPKLTFILRMIPMILLIAFLSAVTTFIIKPLGQVALFLSVFTIYSIALLGTYYHFNHLLKLMVSNIQSIGNKELMDRFLKDPNLFKGHFSRLRDFKIITEQYSQTYRDAQLEQTENESKLRELERINLFKNHILDTLLKVNHLFLNLNDSNDYYSVILNSAIDVIEHADKGSLLLFNAQTERFEFKTCVGFDLHELKKVTMTLEETFLFKNAHGHYEEPTLIKNVRQSDHELLDEESFQNLERAGGLEIVETLSSPIVIDGQIIAILNIDSEVPDAFDEVDKQLIHFFASQIAIALKNKYLVDETVNMSRYDKLTGAYNRNYFEKILSTHKEYSMDTLEPYSLILCDLNYLKIINDTYGHSAGDLILREFSSLIHYHIRETDVFSRIGGDEFVIFLRNISHTNAEEKMAKVFQAIENSTVDFQGQLLPVSFSYGIASSPDDSMIYDVLIKIADIRMYKFKEKYKLEHPDKISFINNF